jgi:sialic acid synthase SpsE
MPKIIAEVGHNFLGSIRWAKDMIKEAKSCGADAVKFQLYDTDKIKKYYQSRYSELKISELTFEDLLELKETADKCGIEFLASAFDTTRVQWLEKINVLSLKLASRSIFDRDLIVAMENTGKPIIASLGWWKEKEFPIIKNAQFLYCISDYPAPPGLPDDFERYDGLSDHSIGIETMEDAVRRGTKIIEKHFTLDKHLPGYDQSGSIDPQELKDFIRYVRRPNKN